MNEILEKNLLGDIKYIFVNSNAKKEILKDFMEEFRVEYEDQGRTPNIFDLEDHFGMKILIDDKISGREKYRLLTKV